MPKYRNLAINDVALPLSAIVVYYEIVDIINMEIMPR